MKIANFIVKNKIRKEIVGKDNDTSINFNGVLETGKAPTRKHLPAFALLRETSAKLYHYGDQDCFATVKYWFKAVKH